MWSQDPDWIWVATCDTHISELQAPCVNSCVVSPRTFGCTTGTDLTHARMQQTQFRMSGFGSATAAEAENWCEAAMSDNAKAPFQLGDAPFGRQSRRCITCPRRRHGRPRGCPTPHHERLRGGRLSAGTHPPYLQRKTLPANDAVHVASQRIRTEPECTDSIHIAHR